MEVEMGLSNYQGTPMSIHYAKRKYDETKLSKQEIDALVRKYGWKYIKKHYHGYEEEPKKKVVFYGSNKKEVKSKTDSPKQSNYRHSEPWESVQERSNEISMRCLGFKYQREDKQNEL